MPVKRSALIIGAGTAGLSMATLLARGGWKVTVLERNGHAGGRTYSFTDPATGLVIDNGQHLLMGCYQFTRRWLKIVGVEMPLEPNLRIAFVRPGFKPTALNLPNIVSPFHMIFGMALYPNLSLADKMSVVFRSLRALWMTPPEDQSVEEWLDDPSPGTKKYFWDPLCLGVMNAYPSKASARLFVRAVREMFFRSREFSRMIVPERGLTEHLVDPAIQFIEKHGGSIRLQTAVEKLETENRRVKAVRLADGSELESDVYISAIPSWSFSSLWESETLRSFFPDWRSMPASPILSAYLWIEGVDVEALFEGKFIGCVDTTIQWVFKKGDNCLEVTISAADEPCSLSREQLLDLFKKELGVLFPNFNKASIRHFQVIKFHNATFLQSPGLNRSRMKQRSLLPNCYAIGDWTDTGLPSTIESAVKSAWLGFDAIVTDFR